MNVDRKTVISIIADVQAKLNALDIDEKAVKEIQLIKDILPGTNELNSMISEILSILENIFNTRVVLSQKEIKSLKIPRQQYYKDKIQEIKENRVVYDQDDILKQIQSKLSEIQDLDYQYQSIKKERREKLYESLSQQGLVLFGALLSFMIWFLQAEFIFFLMTLFAFFSSYYIYKLSEEKKKYFSFIPMILAFIIVFFFKNQEFFSLFFTFMQGFEGLLGILLLGILLFAFLFGLPIIEILAKYYHMEAIKNSIALTKVDLKKRESENEIRYEIKYNIRSNLPLIDLGFSLKGIGIAEKRIKPMSSNYFPNEGLELEIDYLEEKNLPLSLQEQKSLRLGIFGNEAVDETYKPVFYVEFEIIES